MSPVIRIAEDLYKRLESQAKGFDTPNNVIERLLDFYESVGAPKLIPQAPEKTGRSPKVGSPQRKPRDKIKEKELKTAVGKSLNWGAIRLIDDSLLSFSNTTNKVLCKYSSFSADQGHWFWGVPEKYWKNWDENLFLALIMENQDARSYSFLLFKPKDAIYLFTKCSQSNAEIKINLRIYRDDGLPHIQEWKEYNVVQNKIEIK